MSEPLRTRLEGIRSQFEDHIAAGKKLGPKSASAYEVLKDPAFIARAANDGINAALTGLSQSLSDETIGAFRGWASDFPELQPFLGGDDKTGVKPMGASSVGIGQALERMGQEDYRRESPVASALFEAGGSMIPSIVAAPFTAGTSAVASAAPLARVGSQLLRSLGSGAVTGYGEGEGGIDSADRVQKAGLGAGFSLIGDLGMRVLRAPTKAAFGAGKKAFTSATREGQKVARKLVSEAIEADMGSMDAALQYVLERVGKRYTLADIGSNTEALLDAARVLPGPGKSEAKRFLNERNNGSLKRMTGHLQQAFGTDATFFDTFVSLKAARSAAGDPVYAKAYAKNIVLGGELGSLLSRPMMEQALRRGLNLAKNDGVDLGDWQIKGGVLLDAGGVPVQTVSTRVLHYMKRGLDADIHAAKPTGLDKGTPDEYGIMLKLKNSLLREMDAQNAAYRDARNKWAGDSAVMDSLQMGLGLMKTPIDKVDQVIASMADMGRSELEAFRIGVMQSIANQSGGFVNDAVEVAAGNPARNLLKDVKKMKLLRATFRGMPDGEKKADDFISNLLDETRMKETSDRVLGNSASAQRLEFMGRIKDSAAQGVPTGSWRQILPSLISKNLDGFTDAQVMETSRALQAQLLSSGADAEKVMKEIAQGNKATLMGVLGRYAVPVADILTKPRVAGQTAAREAAKARGTGDTQGMGLFPSGLLTQ